MNEAERISTKQLIILVYFFTLGSSVLIGPSLIASEAKNDAWLSGLVACLIGVLLVLLYIRLFSTFPNLTIVEMSESLLGKWLGKLVSLLFTLFLIIIGASTIREMGDFITTHILVETPIQAVHILFLIVSIMCVRLGIEVLSRTSEIFLPWVAIQITILILFLLPEVDKLKMMPMIDYGIEPIIKGAMTGIGFPILELVVFLMITPFVNKQKKAGKSILIGSIFAFIMLETILVLSTLVLGSDFTARNIYSTYILGKKVSIGNFLERIEVLVAIIWFFSMFFKLSICLFATALALAKTCKLNDYRPLITPLSFILYALSFIIYPNVSYTAQFITEIWPWFASVFGFFLPLLLLIISKIKKPSQKGMT